MEGSEQNFIPAGHELKEVTIANQAFDIKHVLMQLLPSLMTIITSFLLTGKLNLPKGMDKDVLRTLLQAILAELG